MDYKQLLEKPFLIKELFDAIPVALALVGRDGRYISVNKALSAFAGLEPSDLVGEKITKVSHSAALNSMEDFKRFDAGEDTPDHELILNGRFYQVSVHPLRDAKGLVLAEMIALTDISKLKETETQLLEANHKLSRLASQDTLTSLFNTRAYYEAAEEIFLLAQRTHAPFSTLFLDLDHFKQINDTYGHSTGDIVLSQVAKCIKETCRTSDVIGRVGGEEFSVFLPETDHSGAMALAEKLRHKIEQLTILVEENSLTITVSIGVASNKEHYQSVADIQRDADHAMYYAKKTGRNKVVSLRNSCSIGVKENEEE